MTKRSKKKKKTITKEKKTQYSFVERETGRETHKKEKKRKIVQKDQRKHKIGVKLPNVLQVKLKANKKLIT